MTEYNSFWALLLIPNSNIYYTLHIYEIAEAEKMFEKLHDRMSRRGIGDWAGRRFWESRQFYSAYIALFVAISNWITIQYRFVLENIPVLNNLFKDLWVFLIVATVVFTIISILGGHYIHRKRQFRIEQAVATEENPYLYRAAPGKEKDLMIPVTIMQLDAIEAILKANNIMTEEKKKQIDSFRQELVKLSEGLSMSRLTKTTTDTNRLTA